MPVDQGYAALGEGTLGQYIAVQTLDHFDFPGIPVDEEAAEAQAADSSLNASAEVATDVAITGTNETVATGMMETHAAVETTMSDMFLDFAGEMVAENIVAAAAA